MSDSVVDKVLIVFPSAGDIQPARLGTGIQFTISPEEMPGGTVIMGTCDKIEQVFGESCFIAQKTSPDPSSRRPTIVLGNVRRELIEEAARLSGSA